jgi:folylpolyglutamate synthase
LLPPIIETLANQVQFSNIIFTTNDPWKVPNAHGGADYVNNNAAPDPELKVQTTLGQIFEDLAKKNNLQYGNITICSSVEEALERVEPRSMVLVTGSLHLVGSVLTVMKSEVL